MEKNYVQSLYDLVKDLEPYQDLKSFTNSNDYTPSFETRQYPFVPDEIKNIGAPTKNWTWFSSLPRMCNAIILWEHDWWAVRESNSVLPVKSRLLHHLSLQPIEKHTSPWFSQATTPPLRILPYLLRCLLCFVYIYFTVGFGVLKYVYLWYPRWDSSPHNLAFETSTYTNSVTWVYTTG